MEASVPSVECPLCHAEAGRGADVTDHLLAAHSHTELVEFVQAYVDEREESALEM